MGWFRKKKKEPIEEFFDEYKRLYMPSGKSKPMISSREFRLFKKKWKEKLGWFEKMAAFSEKILNVNPDENTKKEIDGVVNFTGMRITANGVMSLAILTIIFFVSLSAILVATGMPVTYGLFISMGGVGLAYYFLKYPVNQLKSFRIKASSQVVLAILYMVVSMRTSPNLERALRFTAANISGPLAWDMRRMLWDIEMGKYVSANDALTEYISRWKPENEEFAESLRLIRDSQQQTPDKAEKTLDESLDVILDGTRTRMKHYAQDLRMPISIIHMMGIVLPVLGSIMAPLAAVFLSDVVRPEYFILGYDIILPIIIIWFINNTLKKRPTTFSEVDISQHPELPPKGMFSIKTGKKRVFMPVLPIVLLIGIILVSPAIYYFSSNPELMFGSGGEHSVLSLVMSLMITLGIGFSLATYFVLSNYQRMSIQGDVQSTEGEFELALFQLGNRISAGMPTELALEKSINDVKDLKIVGLFTSTLRNIRNLGMTFKEALFHPKWGSINYYPSMLIRNIMYMVIDITRQGFKYTSDAMLTISRYLKNIRETQEYIRDLLSESVSSMSFQAYLLTPMITGLIVSMAQIIIVILMILGSKLSSLSSGAALPMNITGGLFGFGGSTSAISPEFFQIIIGIYLMEVIIILAIFVTKITQGENKVYQWYLAGKMLIVALIMYFLVAVGASVMFGGLISQAISSMV